MRVKHLDTRSPHAEELEGYPSFHKTGNVEGMKNLYYSKNALLIRCGDHIYNVTSKPEIYNNIK